MLLYYYELLARLRDFFDAGGTILVAIAFVIFAIWLIAVERFIYFRFQSRRDIEASISVWEQKQRPKNWVNVSIRTKLVAECSAKFQMAIPLLASLTALCPLFGLMGTVTGMIGVFDVMAFFGNGNARSMAEGVSKATIPTMAGMTGALCGVFLLTLIKQYADRVERKLEEQLNYVS